jgi:hypothetical protein
MSELATVQAANSLSDMQERLVAAVLSGKGEAEAFSLAGYAETTNRRSVLGGLAVQAALRTGRAAIIAGELSTAALQAMRELLGEKTPAATRLATAKWVLEHGDDSQDEDRTPLHQMTPAQLDRFMARAQATIDAGGDRPIIDVTPNDGA